MEEEKLYPSFRQGIGLMCIYLLGQVGIFIIIGFMQGFGLRGGSLIDYFLSYYIVPLVVGGVTIYYAVNKIKVNWKELKGRIITDVKIYFSLILIILGILSVNSLVVNLLKLAIPMSQSFADNFYKAFEANIFLVLLSGGIICPVLEEVIFRGIILRGFLSHYNSWKAVALSALLFAVIHLNIWQGAVAFIVGIVLGWIYFKTRSLLLVIFGHVVNNSISIVSDKLIGISDPAKVEFYPWWVTTVGVLSLVVGILLFNWYLQNNNWNEEKVKEV